jgi:drug/metabolite transporter (DMT)-like permease
VRRAGPGAADGPRGAAGLPLLVALALTAFAANSVLCRWALKPGHVDALSFTTIRVLSGSAALLALSARRATARRVGGSWRSALALLGYALPFSLAYVQMNTGSGALLLFGVVQVVMIGAGVRGGERITRLLACGWALAVAGLLLLLLPGAARASWLNTADMLLAGVMWGVYSLLGRRSTDALADSAGNFLRAAPAVLLLSLLLWRQAHVDREGLLLAVVSGALTSGVGYAIWYTVLPRLSSVGAARLQLAIPVLAALGGVVLIGDAISLRLGIAAVLVLGGVALAIRPASGVRDGSRR